ncbi:uncharacterized protein LOC106514688 [Austrofundulus limnaeus]|uniref:Uncharacterized protein LOC106514688 n=1 Tax=Austrofundulus limnaeus TaxID=52670 RepID=A0A2I4AVM5_AUSLI|nr:PREDICTED: uncharacterized protein LOC106514688 [Austrofundulus limnaeus]
MKLRLVCLLLASACVQTKPSGPLCCPPVSLNISPNLQQFFSGQSVSLSCPGAGQESGWTIRRSRGGQTEECGTAASCFCVFRESTCVLDLLASYTGLYWCQTGSGQSSEQVNLTVTRPEDSAFVLEIPALPVLTGSDITLQCRHRDGSAYSAYFFKDGDMVGGSAASQNLQEVQRSDEGLYWCSTDKSGSSPQSFLRVRDPPPHTSTSSSPPPDRTDPLSTSPPPLPHPTAFHLLRHLLVVCPYCVCTFVLVSICCSRTSGKQPADSTATSEERDDVTTEHDF